MRLTAPLAVVIGATDPQATLDFLGRFGFVEHGRRELGVGEASALYGLDGPTLAIDVRAPDAERGHLLVVQTPHSALQRGIFDHGPLALDVYTTEIRADHAAATTDGLAVGAIGTLELGPLVMHQCEITAPDGWRLVLVEANKRRPSLLDRGDGRRHSEVHSLLWTVASIEAASPAFTRSGLTQAHVFPINHPELTTILSLPRPVVPMRMNLLVDDQERPTRLELVEFPEDTGAPLPADDRLRGGIHALVLQADDLAAPPGAHLVDVGDDVVAVGRSKDGDVRYQLWPTA